MPPRKPAGRRRGVLKSPWASSQRTRTPGRSRTTRAASSRRSSSPRPAGPGSARPPARPRPGRRPRAGSRASRAGPPPSRPRAPRRASRRAARSSRAARRGGRPAPARRTRRRRRGRRCGRGARRRRGRPSASRGRVHRGSRFSKNARDALLDVLGREGERQAVRAGARARRRSAMSCWRYIASLPSRIITGDFAASRRAQSATAASNSSAGTTLLTIPSRSASSRVDLLAQQQQLVRLLARDVAVDQRHDHEREHADVDLGRAERRALRGDDQVAGQREPERARRARARWRRRCDGLPSSPISRNSRGKRSVAEVLVHERHVGGEAGEVAARAERPCRAWR